LQNDNGKRIGKELVDFRSRRFLHKSISAFKHDVQDNFESIVNHLDMPGWRHVRRAFDETGLDPNDPLCWAELLRLFATVHYKAGDPGRKKRAPSSDWQFARDLLAVSQEKNTKTKAQLAKYFRSHPLGQQARYKSFKKDSGVISAIRALEDRQKKDWLSFAKDVVAQDATEIEGD
jgi:hypothetical protein